MVFRFVSVLFIALSLFCAAEARAEGVEYVQPTWTNVLRSMVRFNALDLNDTALAHEYGLVTECDLYKAFYDNDYKWHQVIEAIRDSVQRNIATYPANFYYDVVMNLDRYDYDKHLFKFKQESVVDGINAILLVSAPQRACRENLLHALPLKYRAVFPDPLYLKGLPLSEADAKALIIRMDRDKNKSRKIYARYYIQVVYIEPFVKVFDKRNPEKFYYNQGRERKRSEPRFDSQLNSIAFFEDRKMSKLIYVYRP